MSKEAVNAGAEFGSIINESLRRTGTPKIGLYVFYVTEIGVQLGSISRHVGKDATLAMLDVLRVEIAKLPETGTKH